MLGRLSYTRICKMSTRVLRSRVTSDNLSNTPKTTSVTRTAEKESGSNGRVEDTTTTTTTTATTTTKAKRSAKKSNASPSKRVRLQTPEEVADESSTVEQTQGSSTTQQPHQQVVFSNRPAEPHRTNVPLVTPKGTRIVAYKNDDFGKSPSAIGLPKPTTTTGHILEDACAHLIKMDPRLKPLIDQHRCTVFGPEALAEECDPFKSLCSSIMAQQVSGAAAASIKRKFIGLFHTPLGESAEIDDLPFPTPEQVAACTVPFLRQAGLSERKAEYIKGLAEKFASGELSAKMLMSASNEEVLEKLTAVRGLGRWSVEMFACFALKRMDVLSTGDLGVQWVDHSERKSYF